MKKTDDMSVFFISYSAVIYLTESGIGQGVKRLGLRHIRPDRVQWTEEEGTDAQAQGVPGSRFHAQRRTTIAELSGEDRLVKVQP